MQSVKEIVKELKVFERNKIPVEVKILGIAIYIHTSSVRRTARILSEIQSVSKSSVHRWIKKFEEKLPISAEKKQRNLIAIDETVVKANRKRYCIYSAVDVERNELILMKVYTTRNYLTTKSFVKEVLEYCENKPKFIIDKAPWLIDALKSLGLEFENISSFGKRSLVESVFSSLKQRVKIFFCSISCSNPVKSWNLFCKLFMLYYNRLRWCLSGHVPFFVKIFGK